MMLLAISDQVWIQALTLVGVIVNFVIQYLTKRSVDTSSRKAEESSQQAAEIRVAAANKVEEVKQELKQQTNEKLTAVAALVEEIHAATKQMESERNKS